jgi:uncharacterized protein
MHQICNSILEIQRDDYQNLINDNPFMKYDFLAALESSGCATDKTGWVPNHIAHINESGKLDGFTPAYLKYHSFGEFIFDHVWVDFYNQIKFKYYPKLLIAIPFTPVRSMKILRSKNTTIKNKEMIQNIKLLLEKYDLSSAHFNFIQGDEISQLNKEGFISRISQQYIWKNNNYTSFNDFLETLTSRKRKMINKERQSLKSDGIIIEWISGENINEEQLTAFYKFYLDTCNRKWGNAYLNIEFFKTIISNMPDNLILMLAKKNNTNIGASLHIKSKDTLYGRYWGANDFYKFLHYELCYYQAIEFAIKFKMSSIESGAGGLHKISRGYSPVITHSAHYFQNQDIHKVIEDYLLKEIHYVNKEVDSLSKLSPFK